MPRPQTKRRCARPLDRLLADTAVAGGEIWIALDPKDMPVSGEEKLRGGDKKIAGCLMIDTLRQAEAEKIGGELARQFPGTEVGVFRVLCQLGRGDSMKALLPLAARIAARLIERQ